MTKHDKEGRQVTIPYEVRGGLVTASASLSNGTAATLLAGDGDYFLDLVHISFANSSGAATIALKSDGSTIRTFIVPANTTHAINYPLPVKQNVSGIPWLVDMEDISGSTITVDAQFIKNN